MSKKNIYNLALHESVSTNNGTDQVTRVPGGWIYERWRYVYGAENYEPYATVFVPFDNEFQESLREDD